ncbi:hypothetical protein INT45_004063 [Circinella minor]|uniref:Uncharacterized protein n=1 Tax=Circinella minor TaxID=1195481 RepID=A0A8H7RXZ7_9FUNG|nr:hypothetical protein INT45_004063 [Circinella minor]
MRGKTKKCIWCSRPVFKVHLRQHQVNECEKNPYADPNNPIEPPPKRQRRRVAITSLPSRAVPETADVNNDDYSFDQDYDDDVYDDSVFDYGDSNMMASSSEPSIIHDAQVLASSFKSPTSSLDDDDIDIDMMDDDTIDVIDSDDNSAVSAAIDETQPSVSITTNERDPIICNVPPMKELDEQLKRSVELYQIVQEKYITDDAYSPGKPILSKYKAETKITDQYPVKPVYYDYCQNGCQIYTDYVSIGCSCGQQRYKESNPNKLQAVSTMLYMPLAEQIAALILNDTRRKKLMTLMDRKSEEDGVREDIFDENMYKKQKRLFKGDMDIAISLYIDGFAPFNKGKTSMTIFNIIILNLSPKERYKNENMIQVCVLPVKLKSMDNFLEPLFIELSKLQTTSLEIRCGAGVFRLNVHLMLTSGDIVAVQELIHHSYRALYGCRIYPIKAVKALSPEGVGNGNYFSGLRNNVHQFRDIMHYIDGAPKTKFAELKSFHGASFFGLDEMHLIGTNVSKRIWEMVSGSFKNTTTMFELSNAARQIIGSSVEKSTSTIPSSIFEGDFRNYHTKPGNMRAVDWTCFLMFVVPTMVCDMLELQLGTEQAEGVIDVLASLSQKNPGVNAGNILRRQQACRYYSSLLEDRQVSHENMDNTRPTAAYSLEITDEEFGDPLSDDVELWDHFEREVDDYSDVNLSYYLIKFWRRKFPDDRIGWNDINDSIIVGRRLYMNEVVYDAMKTKRKTDILCHFVKMDIEVDRKKARRNAPKDLQVQSYFGELIIYFAHEYNGNTNRFTGRLNTANFNNLNSLVGEKHILCLVDILNGIELNSAGCPYGPYGIGHTGGRRYVVEAEAITCHAGILKMPMTNRKCNIYPKMIPKSTIAGDIGLL